MGRVLDILEANGEVVKLTKELVLKKSGSTYTFPEGTIVAFLPTKPKKYSAINSHTKTTVDALTGTVSQTVVNKVKKVSKSLGNIEKNKALISKEVNPTFANSGPIGNIIRN